MVRVSAWCRRAALILVGKVFRCVERLPQWKEKARRSSRGADGGGSVSGWRMLASEETAASDGERSSSYTLQFEAKATTFRALVCITGTETYSKSSQPSVRTSVSVSDSQTVELSGRTHLSSHRQFAYSTNEAYTVLQSHCTGYSVELKLRATRQRCFVTVNVQQGARKSARESLASPPTTGE